jgi:hypothetical protein
MNALFQNLCIADVNLPNLYLFMKKLNVLNSHKINKPRPSQLAIAFKNDNLK